MKVMVIVKASAASEAGEMPSQQLLTEMGNYNAGRVKTQLRRGGVEFSTPSHAQQSHPSGHEPARHQECSAISSEGIARKLI